MAHVRPNRLAAEIERAKSDFTESILLILKSQGFIPYFASIKETLSSPLRFFPNFLYTLLCVPSDNLLANNLTQDVFRTK